MEGKKSYQSWTISDEFWEAIKDEIPKRERDPNKKYVHAPGQGVSQCQLGKRWKGYSMCCGQAVNGKQCRGNMGAAVRYTGDSRSGRQRGFLRKSGPKDWKSTMNWKESAGNGKVWTGV